MAKKNIKVSQEQLLRVRDFVYSASGFFELSMVDDTKKSPSPRALKRQQEAAQDAWVGAINALAELEDGDLDFLAVDEE